MPKGLFDTGALHDSYISKAFVKRNIKALAPFLKPCEGWVRLADNKTTTFIDQMANANIAFIGNDGVEHKAHVSFCVFDMTDNDIIVGLPAIIQHFHALHKQMFDAAVAQHQPITPAVDNSVSTVSEMLDETLRFPWTKAPEKKCPEELETELPSSFSHALHYIWK